MHIIIHDEKFFMNGFTRGLTLSACEVLSHTHPTRTFVSHMGKDKFSFSVNGLSQVGITALAEYSIPCFCQYRLIWVAWNKNLKFRTMKCSPYCFISILVYISITKHLWGICHQCWERKKRYDKNSSLLNPNFIDTFSILSLNVAIHILKWVKTRLKTKILSFVK